MNPQGDEAKSSSSPEKGSGKVPPNPKAPPLTSPLDPGETTKPGVSPDAAVTASAVVAREPDPERQAELARSVKMRLGKMSRRGLATALVSVLGGYGAWRWLLSRDEDEGLIWPLRRILEMNERIARAAFSPSRLAPLFRRDQAKEPRLNGMVGLEDLRGEGARFDPAAWRLNVIGGAQEGMTRGLSLDDIKKLPRFEQSTELNCIEGWSTVTHWAGVRLADLAAATGLASRGGRPYDAAKPAADLLGYVSLSTPDAGYFVALDLPSALHPQTLLCYEMNGEALTAGHGAPLRLVIPVKYGIKSIKRIGTIRFTDQRPADYWASRGYDWYAGL